MSARFKVTNYSDQSGPARDDIFFEPIIDAKEAVNVATYNPIDEMIPVSPTQALLLVKRGPAVTQWTSKEVVFSGVEPDLVRIHATWEAVAAHNPILRAAIHFDPAAQKYVQAILQISRPLDVRDNSGKTTGPPEFSSRLSDQIPYAVVVHDSRTHTYSLTLWYLRVLIDDFSFALIEEDFFRFYRGMSFRERVPLRTYLKCTQERHDRQRSLSYWQSAYDNVFAPKLPYAATSTTEKPQRQALLLECDEGVVSGLKYLKKTESIPRHALLEALWAIILSRHCAAESVAFAVASRDVTFPESRRVVGYLSQLFPLKVDIDSQKSVLDLARTIAKAKRDSSRHADLGYDEIAEQLPSECHVQTFIRYVEDVERASYLAHGQHFPVEVYVKDSGALKASVQFDSHLGYDNVRLTVQHFFVLLEQFVQSPTASIDSLDSISYQERSFILSQGHPAKPPTASLVHELFEEQASLSPDAIAVQYERSAEITFSGMNKLANSIAQMLPLNAHSIIPVCMDVSVEFVAVLIAIMKSGNAYVTLDPENPVERNKFILDDVDAPLVLCHAHYARRFGDKAHVIDQFVSEAHLPRDGVDNLELKIGLQERAYLVYTSGSTGNPKGVVLTHSAATCGISNFRGSKGLRSLLFYNPIFSAAQRTILATLIHGGCLCLANRKTMSGALARIINEMDVTSVGLTSSTASLLSPEQVPGLKQLTLTGELIDPNVVATWTSTVQVSNAYGLSECTQISMGRQLTAGSNPRIVGRPRDTTSAYVILPGTTRLAPLLVRGELCLGGYQLGLEYLNRPDLTKKAFIPNPFGPGRLYRTGDMAVCHEDGSIEILGRIDSQIKINGQRVEPAEVAAVIQRQGEVSAAGVVGATIAGRKCLVACIVPDSSIRQDEIPSFINRIRKHVSDYLPVYMTPSYYLPLAVLPRNANGKLDIPNIRRTAEELGREGLLSAISAFGAAGSEAESASPHMAVLMRIVADVLNIPIEKMSPTQSFLFLGGSSLEAIRVSMSALKEGLHVEVGDIIRADSFKTLLENVSISTFKSDPDPFSLLQERPSSLEAMGGLADAFPVTPMQESLLASLLQNETRYIYQRAYNIKDLDITRLKRAFQTVFDQRPLLRSSFVEHGNGFLQVVRENTILPWEEHDMNVREYKTFDHARSMQFGGTFFRAAALREEVLVISMHHALFDYWSHRFLYEDVALVYLGHSQLLPRPPFSRFVAELIRSDYQEEERFWLKYLDSLHPSVLGGTRDAHSVSMDIKIDLKSVKAKHGFTTGPIIYAAWALVLSIHTNSDDVVFATTLSGRDRPVVDIDSIDGPTLTTVPQRVQLKSDSTLVELVMTVQNGLWAISRHGQYGMRGALRAARQGHVKPFDTMVNYLTPEVSQPAVREVFKPYGPKNVWLSEFQTLELQEVVAGEEFSVLLNSGLDTRRAEFMLEQFANALRSIVEDPQVTIGEMKLMSEVELDFLHTLCPQTSFPVPSFLHANFESVAETEPDRPAIQWIDHETITYGDLNRRTNRLAHYLQNLIKPGDVVALLLDKSPLTIVSILGVMKAGGAYVPLSPDNPAERNNFIIEDVCSKLLLTESHHNFSLMATTTPIFVDRLDVSAFPDSTPQISYHTPSDPAYVIYTSGSTGQPKGVLMSHVAAAAAVSSMVVAERRHEGEWRTLQFANYVFDASVEDIFNTLSSGGCLCMAPTAMMLSDLPSVITQMGVKQAILTPTVARLMTPEQVPTLDRLILGGEPMTSDLIAEWTRRTTLLNVYGPTETAMVITAKELSKADDPKNIGRPLPTASAFILHRDRAEFVPYGSVGELCFGGAQLSTGYFNRSDLTSKAFIDFAGQRLYRTGDLARWLPSGEIECLGRKDNQVKINGHRVELLEIENAIIKTGDVVDSAVVVVTINGKDQLVALCIFKPGDLEEFLDLQPLRDAAATMRGKLTSLTPYMIPKFWIPMGSFPKLPSRKTDRKALVTLVRQLEQVALSQYSLGSSLSDVVIPVQTPEEEVLQRLWANQFNLDTQTLGRNSDFMSLGGDSISAIKLVGQCRREGYKLEVSQVLDNLTLEGMASCMKEMAPDSSAQKQFIVADSVYDLIREKGLDRDSIEDIFPSPPGQVEFLRQGQREQQYWNLMATRSLPSDIDLDHWLQVTTTLTRRNGILRSTFVETPEHGWLQITLKDSALQWEVVHTTAEGKQSIIDSAWKERFEFGKPYIRYKLLLFPDNSRELLVKLDHALYDGQLLRVFDEQFKATSRNEDVSIITPTFKDFALSIWQTPKQSALSFWSDLLSGSETIYPQVDMPTISAFRVQPANTSLQALAKEFSVTIPIIFQTAFQVWLSKTSSRRDVMFDLLVAGRNVNGLEDADKINGTCANFLPFRSRFSANDTIGDYMKATQSLFWKTGENAVVGLDDIFAHLGLDRRSRTSRVLFLYQPFEPAKGPVDHNRWLVLAMSRVRMHQPYAIVVEVLKTHSGHNVKVFYDQTVFTGQEAESMAADIGLILDGIANQPHARVAELVDA